MKLKTIKPQNNFTTTLITYSQWICFCYVVVWTMRSWLARIYRYGLSIVDISLFFVSLCSCVFVNMHLYVWVRFFLLFCELSKNYTQRLSEPCIIICCFCFLLLLFNWKHFFYWSISISRPIQTNEMPKHKKT